MGHNLKLTSFKEICKSSWVFYKTNWKTIVLLFLPIEIAVLICFIVLDLIPQSDSLAVIVSVILFTIFGFIFSSLVKILTLGAPCVVEQVISGERIQKPTLWYWSIIKAIVPISIVLFLIGVLNFGFVSIVFLVSGAIFLLGSLLIDTISSYPSLSTVLNIALIVSLLYVVVKYTIIFFVRGMFSIYVYFFDKRTGLDAVVNSFLLASGKEFAVFWRSTGISVITIIPALILVAPINATIIYQSLGDLYFQVMVLHQEPMITSPSTPVSVLLDVMTMIAGIIGISFSVVMNYYLWRSVKMSATPFEEAKYAKTRKYLKSIIGFGVVFFVVAFVASIVYAVMFG